MDSTQKSSLDASWTKQIGEGRPTPSSSPITILGIAHGSGQIKQFCGQIHDLLKKRVLVQVEPSESEEVNFQTTGFLWVFCVFLPD